MIDDAILEAVARAMDKEAVLFGSRAQLARAAIEAYEALRPEDDARARLEKLIKAVEAVASKMPYVDGRIRLENAIDYARRSGT